MLKTYLNIVVHNLSEQNSSCHDEWIVFIVTRKWMILRVKRKLKTYTNKRIFLTTLSNLGYVAIDICNECDWKELVFVLLETVQLTKRSNGGKKSVVSQYIRQTVFQIILSVVNHFSFGTLTLKYFKCYGPPQVHT